MSGDRLALTELAELLGVLGHADRVRIVLELRAGERDVASVVEALGISQSRTSQHLGLMKAHHLVVARRDGRRVRYSLRDPALATWLCEAFGFLETGANLGHALDASIAEATERYGT
jgi:DNA-binding transcriptional ArsR family regulator